MKISDETRTILVNILKDHKDCLEREDYPMTSGAELNARLRREGIEIVVDEEMIDSKANLIWEIDGLVEKLEKGEDEL